MSTTDFSWIKWQPGQFMQKAEQALAEKNNILTTLKNIPIAERTFENTIVALERANEKLIEVASCIEFLLNVSPNKVTREAAKAAVDYIEAKSIELDYDEKVYQAVKDFSSKKTSLDKVDKKLFADTLRAYHRLGFDLAPAKRKQVKKLFQQLTKITSDFRKNINDYSDYILVTWQELEGLPESYVSGLVKVKDQYKVTLQYPDYLPFMENAVDESKRKELHQKYLRKGGQKNIEVLKRMIKVRKEIARTLGYKTHADYRLEQKMAKNPKTVFAFLESLIKPLQPKLDKDLKTLLQLKQKLSGNKNDALNSHDILYLINQDKKLRLKVDDELVREYFPLEIVSRGMFKIYETLLSVTFKPMPKLPTWHPDVKPYAIYDSRTKKLLSYFFMDMHPREGKYGHAAMFPIIPPYQRADGSYNLPVASMVCNFPKSTKKSPSLLSHDQVETFFHEFGHVMHGLLTTAKYISQSGTSVQRDFVEAPSQMLENWVWDEKILSVISGHHSNPRKKLSGALLKNILNAKQHMIAYVSMRQLTFGMFDMLLHTGTIENDPVKLYGSLTKKYFNIDLPKDQLFPAGFGHLDQYDAGYYGYMWSKVYAADMFTRFRKEGLLNKKTGADYRNYILALGSSEEALDLITKFLKRKPNNKAFLKEVGASN